jgi:hypothetical protein
MSSAAPSLVLSGDETASRRIYRSPRRYLVQLLIAICTVQTALSLTLIWSNTAYIDEANYLWVGRLEIANWLHGASWPSSYADGLFSGSPIIYPPIGAIADSIGGLAAARILSLAFMLGATLLLYLTASPLISRRAALITTALWALSEPAIRLAFATYDPLSVFLTACSAWLIVQATFRRRSGLFVSAAALALALANLSAYSGIVIDPVVIAFALLLWSPGASTRQALLRAAWFMGTLILFFSLVMSLSHAWGGLHYTVVARNIADYQSVAAILSEFLQYSGLILALALTGAIAAASAEPRSRAVLLAILCCAALIVPAAQLHDQTAWSIDKHLAYGIWFATIPAGYGVNELVRLVPGSSRKLGSLCCAVALVYMAVSSWQSAWARYHAWPDAATFIHEFEPWAAQSSGYIFVPGHERNIAEYYTPQGRNWTRWSSSPSLSPPGGRATWPSYYSTQLHDQDYGLIVLFYSTSFSSAPELPGADLVSPRNPTQGDTSQELLRLVGDNTGQPGLTALTLVLESDKRYRLVAVGPYNNTGNHSIFAIWQKKSGT